LRKRCLDLPDLCLLRIADISAPQLEARIPEFRQRCLQLAGRTDRRRRWIVELVGQAARQLTERDQAIVLLFDARAFSNSFGHHGHEAGGQFRHLLHQLWEKRNGKSQKAAVAESSPTHRELLHSGKGINAADLPGVCRHDHRVTAKFTAPLKGAFQEDEHPSGWISLAHKVFSRMEDHFLRVA
jgi:hypothetical protein